MECVVTSVVERRLGALPVAAEFLRRLDVAGTVDRLCPGRRDIAHLTHGQVIEALVANRPTAPAPLWRVDRWAGGTWHPCRCMAPTRQMTRTWRLPASRHGHPKDR